MRCATFFIYLSLATSIFADETEIKYVSYLADRSITVPTRKIVPVETEIESEYPPGPVLTGPLLTPAANTIPPAHYNIEPYLFVLTSTGDYDNHWHLKKLSPRPQTINLQFPIQIGLTSFMDLEITPQFFFNSVEDIDNWRFGDFFIGLDFLLVRENDRAGIPALKFFVDEIIPTGTFEHLREENLGTDMSGRGTYVTIFGFVTSYLWRFKPPHFLATRTSISYWVSSNLRVHGVNAYGGDPTTIGRVFPGDIFQLVTGFEYTVTQCWAVAMDFELIVALRNKFCGCTKLPVGRNNTSIQFSLAPAIEYNYSPHVGMIGGVWFTVAGKNSGAFVSGVLAINIYV